MTPITFSSPLFVTIKLFKTKKLKYAEMNRKILKIISPIKYGDSVHIYILIVFYLNSCRYIVVTIGDSTFTRYMTKLYFISSCKPHISTRFYEVELDLYSTFLRWYKSHS